jgi:hypothetical protein
VMLSLAEEASPLGTAEGAIVAVSMRGGFAVGRWECLWRRISRSVAVMEKDALSRRDAFNRVAESEVMRGLNLLGVEELQVLTTRLILELPRV